MLDRLVEAQAATVGATHVFVYVSLVFAAAAAIIWLAPRSQRPPGSNSAH